ncbi:MAG: UDP-N-acetylmuramate dehydrogenase [Puniceicoccales bacterium]|jgi:UDP-N-acetylenolpyruvoylglucosamine reductase|nr:UDP-N-acetylmuramate dehydrogenase [Puniceicoccales bacterium]
MYPRNFIFVGVFGMGMAPLAIYMAQQGHTVYGWDDNENESMALLLEKNGIVILAGDHWPKSIDQLIYSNAIGPNHPMLNYARLNKLEYIKRGIFLSKIAKNKKLVAITGSHGKSSATALLIHLLKEHSVPFSHIIGALPRDRSFPANFDKNSELLICEVDESDGTIENFTPYITTILNFDDDHLINYGSFDAMKNAISKLFSQTSHSIIVPQTDEMLVNLAKASGSAPRKFCPDPSSFATHNLFAIFSTFEAITGTKPDLDKVNKFNGLQRRDDFLGIINGHDIFCDYAHNPAEISAYITSKADKKNYILFQPHRYTRTKQYLAEFSEVLKKSIQTVILPVYKSDEIDKIPGGTSQDLLNLCHDHPTALAETNHDLQEKVSQFLSTTDEANLLFIGAGSLNLMANAMIKDIKAKEITKELHANGLADELGLSVTTKLSDHSTFKIGGTAKIFTEPSHLDSLLALLSILKKYQFPWLILGNGSNMLFDDEGFAGAVIALTNKFWKQVIWSDENTVTVSAGTSLKTFCHDVASHGFLDIAGLCGIPSTVGGALIMNAGANNMEISTPLISVKILNANGEICNINKSELKFSYRSGIDVKSGIILSALFQFKNKAPLKDIMDASKEFTRKRLLSQPLEPSAGSVFKNPPSLSAGRLIDDCGLKGTKVGGASISPKHANFIVNNGHASAIDVKTLIKIARERVYEKHEIFLNREILLASELI